LSPLTKLFVVLQVILSIALTAAVVVYVSKEDVQLANLKAANTAAAAAQSERDAAVTAMTAATSNANAIQERMNSQATQLNNNLTAAQQQIADLNVQLAKSNTSNATQALQITQLTEGLKAATDTTANLNTTVAQLRTASDDAVRRAAEASQRISELDNTLQVTEAQRRNLAEQLAEATQNTQRMSRLLQQNNLNPNTPADQIPAAGIAINGVIREKRDIAGVPYATISVGSADDVQRGMEFKVINGGQFLGTLTVDSVEQQEATGVLKGPHVADIKPGVQVRTQY
jgi:predicted  nucleic acid-binding Zn-ribbon protein